MMLQDADFQNQLALMLRILSGISWQIYTQTYRLTLWGYKMRLYTDGEQRMVDVGTGRDWYSVYSTAMIKLPESIKKDIPLAIQFFKTGECSIENLQVTRRQVELVRKGFSLIDPRQAVFDLRLPNTPPPWQNNIAPSVTSCADLFTTADGKNLFTEVLLLFAYAEEKCNSIHAG